MSWIVDLYHLILQTANLDRHRISRIQTDTGKNGELGVMIITFDNNDQIEAKVEKGIQNTLRLKIAGKVAKKFFKDLQYRTNIATQPPCLNYITEPEID